MKKISDKEEVKEGRGRKPSQYLLECPERNFVRDEAVGFSNGGLLEKYLRKGALLTAVRKKKRKICNEMRYPEKWGAFEDSGKTKQMLLTKTLSFVRRLQRVPFVRGGEVRENREGSLGVRARKCSEFSLQEQSGSKEKPKQFWYCSNLTNMKTIRKTSQRDGKIRGSMGG